MKAKSILFVVLIAMSLGSAVYGHDGPEMAVVVAKGSDVFKVIYKGSTSGNVRLNVFDSHSKIVHSASVAGKNGFICPLNFKGLPTGSYTIEVIDDHSRHKQKVDYVTAYDRKSIHVSKLIKDDGRFLLAVANAQNEPIFISIYDQHQRLLYSTRKTLKGDFAEIFRMANGFNHCTFKISDGVGNEKVFVF